MTKTISLADDAYEALAAAKRRGESFSDVARRLARLAARDDLLDPDLRVDWSEEDADRLKRAVRAARDESVVPRVDVP